MKAIQINKYGGPEVLELVDIEKPKAEKGQVVIEAYASNINPVDVILRAGHMAKMMPLNFPATLGSDVSGVVSEVGESVEDFKVGDKVYGSGIVLAGASGAFAEFVMTQQDLIAKMPENIGFNEAAAVVLVGVSAVQALVEHMNLQAGHPSSPEAPAGRRKILIHGGAGGIGSIAVQVAKKLGAEVTATAAADELEFVKDLGADGVIDYRAEAFDLLLRDYDAVFDTVGGETYAKSFKVLKRGGVIVSMVAPIDEKLAEEAGVKAITQFTKVNTGHLTMLGKFIEEGTVKVHIDKIFPLDKIKEAFEAKEKGGVKGKIVIEIKK
ncbi:NADP-dependent oxidoreductase [Candidatus Parcubacteria bacterium]|nr:NADP-dependent oxidoreductase [Candidatus Parcubacteria bacterium]